MRRITTTKARRGGNVHVFTDRYTEDGSAEERIGAPHADEYGTEEELPDYERESTPDVLDLMKGRER